MNMLYKLAIAAALGTATLCAPVSRDALAQVAGPSSVGADVADNPNGLGVVVTRIDPGGPFAQAGIEVRDVVVAINSQPVTDTAGFYAALGTPPPGTVLFVRVQDHRRLKLVTLRVTTS